VATDYCDVCLSVTRFIRRNANLHCSLSRRLLFIQSDLFCWPTSCFRLRVSAPGDRKIDTRHSTVGTPLWLHPRNAIAEHFSLRHNYVMHRRRGRVTSRLATTSTTAATRRTTTNKLLSTVTHKRVHV